MYTNYTIATIVSKAYLLCILLYLFHCLFKRFARSSNLEHNFGQLTAAHMYIHARDKLRKHSVQIHWTFCGKYIHKYSLYRKGENIVYLQTAVNKLKLWAANSLTWEAVGALKSNWDSCFVFALFLFKIITERRRKKKIRFMGVKTRGKYWMDMTAQSL